MDNQTISDSQRKLNEELHKSRPDFGSRGGAGNQGVIEIIGRYKDLGMIGSVLDYGTGKGAFPKSLKKAHPDVKVGAYDPAVQIYNKKPSIEFDLVTSFDVLEHVEIDYLDNVLDDLKSLIVKLGILCISTRPAKKFLSDGRNAHIIQAPISWWMLKICERFDLEAFNKINEQGTKSHGFWVLVKPKKQTVKINS